MVAIQEISARIGRITGHGIAGNVCRNFPAPMTQTLIVLLFIGNTFTSDLGAVTDSLKLLIGGPAALYVVIFGAVSVLAPVLFAALRVVPEMAHAFAFRLCLCARGHPCALEPRPREGFSFPKSRWTPRS